MPIRKFRNLEEMDAARRELWCDEPDAAYFRRVAKLWETSSRLNPRKFPTGVFKFRNQEEAQAQRDKLLREHVQALRQSRVDAGKMKTVQKGRF